MRPFSLGSGRFAWQTRRGCLSHDGVYADIQRTYGDHDIVSVLLSNAFQALSDGRSGEPSRSNSLQDRVDGGYGESRHCNDVGGDTS